MKCVYILVENHWKVILSADGGAVSQDHQGLPKEEQHLPYLLLLSIAYALYIGKVFHGNVSATVEKTFPKSPFLVY